MAKTQILEYTIHLTNQADADAYNAMLAAGTGPGTFLRYFSPAAQALVNRILRAPSIAATEFSAPVQLDTAPFLAPCIRSPWFTNGANFPTTVATFTRKSGGWFGIPLLFGSTTRFYWAGTFRLAIPSVETPGDPPPVPPPVLVARRWIDGFELPEVGSVQTGEGGSAGAAMVLRDASRTHDGFGYACRDRSTSIRQHTVMENRGGGASDKKTSWERVYIRAKRFPSSGEVDLWRGVDNSGVGVILRLATDGRLLAYSWVGGATSALIGTGPVIALNTWYKFDLVIGFRGVTPAWASDAPVGNGPGNLYSVGQWVVRNSNNYQCIVRTSTILPPPNNTVDNDPLNNSGAPYWAIKATTAGKVGSFRVYLNGAIVIDLDGYSQADNTEVNPQYHDASRIGPSQANDAELDFDDWIGVDCPTGQLVWFPGSPDADDFPGYVTLETQADFLAGTHCQMVRPDAQVSATNWTGIWQSLTKRLIDNLDTANRLTSTTSGALIDLSTDVSPTFLRDGATGIGAVVVGAYISRGSGTAGNDTVGGILSLDADNDGVEDSAPAFSAIVVPPASAVFGWRTGFYDAAGLVVAPKLLSLRTRYTHGADVINRIVESLHAVVELLGTFGPEDLPPASEPTLSFPVNDPHHSQSPYSQWALTTGPKFGVAAIISGTYVGTGAPLDLPFALPPCFLWIRRTSGTAAQMSGFRWWPSMLTGHVLHGQQPISPWIMSRSMRDDAFPPAAAEDDQEQQWLVRLITADDKVNASGVTYNYTAICDPAARYVRCAASFHASGFPITDPLIDPQFTPLAGLFYPEDRGSATTSRMAYKGPGHAAGEASLLSGAALLEDYVDFETGALLAGENLYPSGIDQAASILFRHDDGNAEAPIFQHATYVGNAVSPRTLALLPAFGVRPIWGFVIGPDAAQDRYRDTSHTGTTSTDLGAGTSIAANGIQGGGIDQIIVGSDLNASGVTYHVFVLPGSATAGEGGWGVAGTYYVSEPDSPLDDGWEEPEELTPAVDPGAIGTDAGSGDGPTQDFLDLDDDLADAACVTPTTKVVNRALSRIGVNTPIGTLSTEASAEAEAVRLHYDEALHATLRDRPWPFATRYATLTKLAGTVAAPANGDWTFSYQIPDNCLLARRLVTSRGSAVNPTPPPMRIAGGVLFTNQDAAELEYTARPSCPARRGDPTFRNAWTWRLSAELAPALTRMEDKTVHCWEMYEQALQTADKFLRLGAPGSRPDEAVDDPDASALTQKLAVINRALLKIGAQTIADFSAEQSREALAAALVYEPELRATLRDFPWSFATRYATLALVDGAVDDPAAPDWFYSYRAPASMLFARRLVKNISTTAVGRSADPDPAPYRVGSDDDGFLIYTNYDTAVLEYTIRVAIDKADDSFLDCLAWRLAAALAPSVGRPDPEAEEQVGRQPNPKDAPTKSESAKSRAQQLRQEQARWAWAMYLQGLDMARASNTNESQPEKPGDASWITGRA